MRDIVTRFLLLLCLWLPTLPLWADYGCRFLMNERLSSTLNSSDQKIAFRFTSRQDANVIGLSFFCQDAQNPPAYLISLQEDKNGAPSGIPLGTASLGPRPASWNTVPINNIALTQGKIYHLVIEDNITRGGFHPVGVIGPNNNAAFAYSDFSNDVDPQDAKPDSQLNVLLFQKGVWKKLDRQPLFAVHESGSQLQGDPYDDSRALPIHGNGTPQDRSDDVLQGEALHPHCAFTASAIVLRVRKEGNPTAPLNYRVYTNDYRKHITSLAFSGVALDPGQAASVFQWVTVKLRPEDHPQGFPDECRYIVFQTDSGQASSSAPGCGNCYLLSEVGNSGGLADACDLTFDGGPHLSREATSTNGGVSWIDAFERDANVVLIGPDCSSMISTIAPQTHPLTPPASLFRFLQP
jgi:hypothetical protein